MFTEVTQIVHRVGRIAEDTLGSRQWRSRQRAVGHAACLLRTFYGTLAEPSDEKALCTPVELTAATT
jgi:hypothetical protein